MLAERSSRHDQQFVVKKVGTHICLGCQIKMTWQDSSEIQISIVRSILLNEWQIHRDKACGLGSRRYKPWYMVSYYVLFVYHRHLYLDSNSPSNPCFSSASTKAQVLPACQRHIGTRDGMPWISARVPTGAQGCETMRRHNQQRVQDNPRILPVHDGSTV